MDPSTGVLGWHGQKTLMQRQGFKPARDPSPALVRQTKEPAARGLFGSAHKPVHLSAELAPQPWQRRSAP